MALNFPNSPSLNDLHEENLTKWRWNGSSWIRVVTTSTAGAQGFQGAQGATAAAGAQGAQGHQGHQGNTGNTGPTGNTGAQGDTAAAGAQGAQGAQGVNGNFGGASFEYTFLTNTTDSDPGAGKLKFNNSNLTSATILYIDDTDGGSSNTDIQPFLRTIDDSTSTIKGHVKVSTKTTPDEFVLYTIASLTEATGYFKVTVAYVSGSVTSFSNSSDVSITFARTGDAGSDGAQGAQGYQGAGGAGGGVGPTGAQGHQGNTGNAGAQGAQGNQGLQGAQAHISTTAPSSGVTVGDLWWESDTGDLSIYYDDGSGSPSAQWVEVGSMGPTGAQGNAGAQGAQGHQGHQGAGGSTGSQGNQGQTGTVGTAGAQGAQGHQGDDGAGGSAGAQGAQGAQGHQGHQGAGGTNGTNGTNGAQGHQGHQGAGGSAGAQGAQGHQGHQGAGGSAGAQGNQGHQGSAGSATISSNADNRVITGGSGTNLTGESSLTFNGTLLDVNAEARANNFYLRANGSAPTADASIFRPADNSLAFATASTERVRIDSSGQMGIGLISPGSLLHVYHATTNTIAQFQSGDSGAGILLKDNTHYTRLESTDGTFKIDVDAGGQIGSESISFQISNSEKASIDSSGNFTAQGSIDSASDLKLKTNVTTIENALDKVLKLRGVEFNRVDIEDRQIGVIAQEVEKIIPEVVHGDDLKSVSYGNLVGLLIEAIKEQNIKINKLKKDIEDLKS